MNASQNPSVHLTLRAQSPPDSCCNHKKWQKRMKYAYNNAKITCSFVCAFTYSTCLHLDLIYLSLSLLYHVLFGMQPEIRQVWSEVLISAPGAWIANDPSLAEWISQSECAAWSLPPYLQMCYCLHHVNDLDPVTRCSSYHMTIMMTLMTRLPLTHL